MASLDDLKTNKFAQSFLKGDTNTALKNINIDVSVAQGQSTQFGTKSKLPTIPQTPVYKSSGSSSKSNLYSKTDEFLGGYLPGGISPLEAKNKKLLKDNEEYKKLLENEMVKRELDLRRKESELQYDKKLFDIEQKYKIPKDNFKIFGYEQASNISDLPQINQTNQETSESIFGKTPLVDKLLIAGGILAAIMIFRK